MTDTRKENIFYVCSFFSQNKLFSSMCESKKLSKKCIQDGIVQPNLDRRTALDLVTEEDTALEILKDFDHTANKLTWRDREDKNIFHHYARKNFSRAIQQLIKKLPPVEVRDMILQKSSHTAPHQCQPDRSVTLDIMIDSSFCDRDMTISVAG